MKTQTKLTVSTSRPGPRVLSRSLAPVATRSLGLRTSTAAILLLLGWATPQPGDAAQALIPRVAGPIPLELETIAVTAPDSPAKFSFDKAKGQIEYAGDAAGEAARAVLEPPRDRDAAVNAVSGAAGTVLAPFAAVYGAISAGSRKLTPGQLSESEASLVQAMALMADQKHLREQFLKAAREKARRHLVPVEALASLPASTDPVSAMVETRVEELRLERTGSSDTSFALTVKARARLVRAVDGATLFDQSFQFRTGKGLFLDWTLHGVFQKLAENAYRELAEQMVAQLFATALDRPMLVGAGYKKSPARPPQSPGMLVAGQPQPRAFAQFVNHPVGTAGPVGIFSTEKPSRVAMQRPLTKAEAMAEAVSDVEWSLDGLQDFQNPIISCAAIVPAIPISLYKQAVGAIRGLTRKQYQAADAQLSSATRRARPEEGLAYQVALALAPRTSQPVMLANTPLLHVARSATGAIPLGTRATLVRSDQTPNAGHDRPGQVPETALEIQVLSTSLRGKPGINPRLALCVEAQVTLWRVSDGRPLGCFPVHYRSTGRTFVDWAAHDARRFRQELEQCYRELGRAMADQILPPGLRAPDRAQQPILADNSK